ncbi:hypothetical protein ACB094_11G063000 [Castanea mollissima]
MVTNMRQGGKDNKAGQDRHISAIVEPGIEQWTSSGLHKSRTLYINGNLDTQSSKNFKLQWGSPTSMIIEPTNAPRECGKQPSVSKPLPLECNKQSKILAPARHQNLNKQQ